MEKTSGANLHPRATMSSSTSVSPANSTGAMRASVVLRQEGVAGVVLRRSVVAASQSERRLDAKFRATSNAWNARACAHNACRGSQARQGQQQRPRSRSSGGTKNAQAESGQLLTARPVGPRWLSKMEPRGRLGGALGRRERAAQARQTSLTGSSRKDWRPSVKLCHQLSKLLGARHVWQEPQHTKTAAGQARVRASGTTRTRRTGDGGTGKTRRKEAQRCPDRD